jgi:hypothetical protein
VSVFLTGPAVDTVPQVAREVIAREAPRLRLLALELQRTSGLPIRKILALMVREEGRTMLSVGRSEDMLTAIALVDAEVATNNAEKVARQLEEPYPDTQLGVFGVFEDGGVCFFRLDLVPVRRGGQA